MYNIKTLNITFFTHLFKKSAFKFYAKHFVISWYVICIYCSPAKQLTHELQQAKLWDFILLFFFTSFTFLLLHHKERKLKKGGGWEDFITVVIVVVMDTFSMCVESNWVYESFFFILFYVVFEIVYFITNISLEWNDECNVIMVEWLYVVRLYDKLYFFFVFLLFFFCLWTTKILRMYSLRIQRE